MRDGVHVRQTLSRGRKVTSSMDRRMNQYGSCLIVLAEWKEPVYSREGVRLVTSSWRRNSPQCVDSKIHHNNLINNILAKIEANAAGADDALMLDLEGYLAETNATNVFVVRGEEIQTPHADYCLPGITRGVVLKMARPWRSSSGEEDFAVGGLRRGRILHHGHDGRTYSGAGSGRPRYRLREPGPLDPQTAGLV